MKNQFYLTQEDKKHFQEMSKWFRVWKSREGGSGPDASSSPLPGTTMIIGTARGGISKAGDNGLSPTVGYIRPKMLTPGNSGPTSNEKFLADREPAGEERVYNLSPNKGYAENDPIVAARIGNQNYVILDFDESVTTIGYLAGDLEASVDPRLAWALQPSVSFAIVEEAGDGVQSLTGDYITVHSKHDTPILAYTFAEVRHKRGVWQIEDANCGPTDGVEGTI